MNRSPLVAWVVIAMLSLSGCATFRGDCYNYTYRSSVHPLFDRVVAECPARPNDQVQP